MRVTLIHNPGAGRHGDAELERLLGFMRAAGHQVRQQSAKEEGWAAALDESADVVAVAGGDGTIGRVAKHIAGRGTPIAPLPAGTANNICTTLGLVGRPLEELVRGWRDGRHFKLDLGVAEGPWGRRYFLEGLGAGLFAHAADVAPKDQLPSEPAEKVRWAIRNLRERLRELKPMPIEASLDGVDVSGEFVLFEALNIPFVGPNLFLAPDSKPGDGQLDLVMATHAERERLVEYLLRWEEKKQRLAVLPSRQGQHLRMQWSGYRVHIDDEFWPGEAEKAKAPAVIDVRIEDVAVDFLAPAKLKPSEDTKR